MVEFCGGWMRTARLGAAVFLLAAVMATAHAEDPQAAREHYAKGLTLYDLGKYREAAAEFEASYQAAPQPALLFNLAQAYRAAGDNASALRTYRSYLRREPEAPNRAEVES